VIQKNKTALRNNCLGARIKYVVVWKHETPNHYAEGHEEKVEMSTLAKKRALLTQFFLSCYILHDLEHFKVGGYHEQETRQVLSRLAECGNDEVWTRDSNLALAGS
jgi:hypothetical protein